MYLGNYYIDDGIFNNLSKEDEKTLKDFIKLIDEHYAYQKELGKVITYEELRHIFAISKFNPELQIEIWRYLPNDIANNDKNVSIYEDILENKFGKYIQGINKKALVEMLNNSRQNLLIVDEETNKVVYEIVSLVEQMNSSLFENPIATDAFSFEQLLEIISVKDTEKKLKSILQNSNSRQLLINIGKDSQSWQDKLQYLMNLETGKRNHIIDEFGINGKSLIQEELKRREELFVSMERGYLEDKANGKVFDCKINPSNMLNAIFGISYDEAKDLIKKYGIDSDNLNIKTDDDRKIYRKLQIIKELTTSRNFESYEEETKYYEDYYYSNKVEWLEISKDVSVFYKVNLEKSFLDLYARQYDMALGVQTNPKENVSYDGKTIPVYEVCGDFMLLIRGEQNVSPENKQNFWNSTKVGVNGLCQCTISEDYIRTVNYEADNLCFLASTSCKDGELRMASTTNIKSEKVNNALSNLGISSNYGNGVVLRTPQEQINNSRGTNNETITSRKARNTLTGLFERKPSDYVVYIQDTNDIDIEQDTRFKTAQFVASQTGWPILVIPREKCAENEKTKIQELKDKLLGNKERSKGETDENIIKELIVKFNNNREGILTSKGLREKYFTEGEHIELVGTINARLSQLMETNPKQYEGLVQIVSRIYKDEINKYYAFSYDRDDAQKELDIDSTREHLKPYEDFLMEHERNIFNLSTEEKNNIYDTIKNISKTSYYDMNKYHSLGHIQKVIMFSGILAKNENLNFEETKILLVAAAFHDSGRDGIDGENNNHAIVSTEVVREYFENNSNNPFGITSENISMIQAVIEYHEHVEPQKGITDIEKLLELWNKYDISYEKFLSLVKISELLKDADALDRARFGKKNENRWSLDAKYLKSETAKSISMLRFSEECNFLFKEKETKNSEKESEILPENIVEEIFENELNEFSRPKIQMSSLKEATSGITAGQKKSVMDGLKNIQITSKKLLEGINR